MTTPIRPLPPCGRQKNSGSLEPQEGGAVTARAAGAHSTVQVTPLSPHIPELLWRNQSDLGTHTQGSQHLTPADQARRHGAEHWSHERDPMTETGMKGLSRQGMALSPPPPGLPSTQQEAQVPGSSTGKGITLNHSYAQPHLRPTAPPTGQRQLRSRPPWPEPQTMAFWNILSRSIAVVYCPLPGNQRWLIHFYFF